MPNTEGQQQEKTDYDLVNEFADRLGLDDSDKERFITSSMKRLGWKPRTQWEPPEQENEDGNEDGDFFTGKRRQREQRQVGGGSGGGNNDSGRREASGSSGWQYGD